jgi:hypothetical protein
MHHVNDIIDAEHDGTGIRLLQPAGPIANDITMWFAEETDSDSAGGGSAQKIRRDDTAESQDPEQDGRAQSNRAGKRPAPSKPPAPQRPPKVNSSFP